LFSKRKVPNKQRPSHRPNRRLASRHWIMETSRYTAPSRTAARKQSWKKEIAGPPDCRNRRRQRRPAGRRESDMTNTRPPISGAIIPVQRQTIVRAPPTGPGREGESQKKANPAQEEVGSLEGSKIDQTAAIDYPKARCSPAGDGNKSLNPLPRKINLRARFVSSGPTALPC